MCMIQRKMRVQIEDAGCIHLMTAYMYVYIYIDIRKTIDTRKMCVEIEDAGYMYGVATVSRIDKIIGLFCRISSLL